MKKFVIKTLGCKTNHFESEIIIQNLTQNGFEKTDYIAQADYFILNSCTVTSHADSQAHYLLNRAKAQNPGIITVVCGCLAQVEREIPNADIILGNQEKLTIAEHLDKSFVGNISKEYDFDFHLLENSSMTRPTVKIQDGCNNFCTYCTIPKARGRSRSAIPENITEQINLLVRNGHKEVVLTGIHIGQWGLEWGEDLSVLLKEIEKTDITRYRLGSLYVNEIDDKLLEVLKSSKKFCPHFHLSLQSMCNKTLSAMGRRYTVEEAQNIILKLKENFKLPFLGCDIIVGFPNESDEDFETTYNNLKDSELSKIHVFPYSKRKNTPAATMRNQIREGIKTQRARKLTELSDELYKKFVEKNKNVVQEVLFERKSLKKGLNCGITRNYIKIYTKEVEDLKGQIQSRTLEE